MRTQIRVSGYSTETCRRVKVGATFDEDGKLVNARAVAASSLVGWGKWDTSAKVETEYDPAWYVTTAGHGGFILVTQEKHDALGEPTLAIESSCRCYVYEFEEDINYAVLMYLDENALRWGADYRGVSREEQRTAVVRVLKSWLPDWLAEQERKAAKPA